jgi:hypothetical protein
MTLDLNVNEVNLIMQALGNMPYAQVFELVRKIQEQAQAQLKQTATEENAQ